MSICDARHENLGSVNISHALRAGDALFGTVIYWLVYEMFVVFECLYGLPMKIIGQPLNWFELGILQKFAEWHSVELNTKSFTFN